MNYFIHMFEIAIITQNEEAYMKINEELKQLSEMFNKDYFSRKFANHPWLSSISYERILTPISHISLYHKTHWLDALYGLRKELVVIDDDFDISESLWHDSLSATLSEHDGRVILLSDFLKLPITKYLSAPHDHQKWLYLDLMANNFLMKNGIAPLYVLKEEWCLKYPEDYSKYLEHLRNRM